MVKWGEVGEPCSIYYSVLMISPFEKGWETANKTQEEVEKEIEAAFNTIEDQRPDRPPSYSFIAKGNEILHNIPPVPEPYETWDPKNMY